MNFSKPTITRSLLILAGLFLGVAIFVPLWYIYLDAPQYPEGLRLEMYPNRLAGDVDIINGLNHYIGMKTLHTEDFVEFKILPYIIGFFALLFIATALIGKKRMLYISMILFILFGILAMYDFWRWEYNYGHDLDPNAAIKVPGMSYQPPLIGFKQLLNFGAFSIPALGGWLFIAAGALVLTACILEWRKKRVETQRTIVSIALLLSLTFLSSCGTAAPEPITINKDNCAHCMMTIADAKYACEILTDKGRVYKFDDIICLAAYKKNNANLAGTIYFSDFNAPGNLVKEDDAVLINAQEVRAPMGGSVVAFNTRDAANKFLAEKSGEIVPLAAILNQ